MIIVKLREAIERHRHRTGSRLTYAKLAEMTGLSLATVDAIASRQSYNPTLMTIEKLCRVLECTPGQLLEISPDRNSSTP